MFSVFTPTHRPDYLLDAYRSLKQQTRQDWEWLLLPNGESSSIPDDIKQDSRVKIVTSKAKPGIGLMKHTLCAAASGEYLVELDHDDELFPQALEHLAEKFDSGADFVYSDTLVWDVERQDSVLYDSSYGWDYGRCEYNGRTYPINKSFEPTAASLAQLQYAPDHVRSWRTSFYRTVGGHNPDMLGGDDHDLLVRSYLAHGKFAHTGHCDYLYRKHAGCTHRGPLHKEIWRQAEITRNKHAHNLIREWCLRENLRDMQMVWPRDRNLLANLDGKLPIAANSHGRIWLFDVLQYLSGPRAVWLFNELYRVLAPGGWLCIAVPRYSSPAAHGPGIKSSWSELSFQPFTDSEYSSQDPSIACKFHAARCFVATPQHIKIDAADSQYVFADLCALKGQRQAGSDGI